jgi:hypothetical protein
LLRRHLVGQQATHAAFAHRALPYNSKAHGDFS